MHGTRIPMETTSLKIPSFCSTLTHLIPNHSHFVKPKISCFGFKSSHLFPNGSVSRVTSQMEASCSAGDRNRKLSSLESLFCYDKAIPEQKIEKPVGLSIAEKQIGDQPTCTDCQAKGAVLCITCGGSGLYVDSIMESQGIIVKVRCLSCGGTGNTLCSDCGGRGHL